MIKKRSSHKMSEETKRKISEARKGVKHPLWKGGIVKASGGYVRVICPDHPFKSIHGYVPEHRLVVEKQIGRFLTKKETVHHLNEIKNDNRPENLMAFSSHSVHLKFHNGFIPPSKYIIFDGRKINH